MPVRRYEGRSSIEPDVGVPSHQAAVPEPTSAFNLSQQGHAHRRSALDCLSTLISGTNHATAVWRLDSSLDQQAWFQVREIASEMRLPQ